MSFKLIFVECKKGYEVKLGEAVLRYVREIYGEEPCLEVAVAELDRMRKHALVKMLDKHEGAVESISRYYDQLVAIEGKLPMEDNIIRIDFMWDDVFAKGNIFGKKSGIRIASGGYERICILFNIAALHSQVAETQNLSDDTGLRNATKYLQQAARIFSYLKSTTPTIIQGESPSDLNADTLNALSTIMMAQAQELIYIKAARVQINAENVGKIAQGTSDLYADALTLTEHNSIRHIWPKEWISLIKGKQVSFQALAQYYQAKFCGEKHYYGEEIARLQKASELMKISCTEAGSQFLFDFEQDRINKELERTEKENNMIYHDGIPNEASLSLIPKIIVARELPFENPINKDFKDLFNKIVPVALQSAMNVFRGKQNSLVNVEIFRLKEATDILSRVLTSLNIPAVFDDNIDEVTNILLKKSEALKNSGGIDKIEELLSSLPDIIKRNNDLLAETIKILDDEEQCDQILRDQFKGRCNRTPSKQLTESWRVESLKFNEFLRQAKLSDELIQKRYQEYGPQIRILSQNESIIKESIPNVCDVEDKSEHFINNKEEIIKIYCEIESVSSTRVTLLHELCVVLEECDIGNIFVKRLIENGSLNVETLAEEEIHLILSPFKERVDRSLIVQENLLVCLQEKCAQSSLMSSSNKIRCGVISSSLLAIDKYNEISINLEEGIKFYGELGDILLKFQNKIKDFSFARKTEMDDLLKELQQTFGGTNTVAPQSRTQQFPATQPYYPPSGYNISQSRIPYGYQIPDQRLQWQVRPAVQMPRYPNTYTMNHGYNQYHPR